MVNYISLFQHSFLPKLSILTNLLTYKTFLLQLYSTNCQVDIDTIYTDFQDIR